MQLLSPLDLAKNELRQAALHNLTAAPSSPVVGQVWYDTTNKQAWICTNATGPVWAELTNNYDQGGNVLSNLGAPVNNTDAATKLYVDASRQGLAFKDPVRIATTANLTSTYAGGVLTSTTNGPLTHEGVTLALSERVLVMSQTDSKQNGIYYVSQVGVAGASPWKLTRATDADGANEVVPGAFVFVLEGTTNADTAFVCSNNAGAIVIDTTSITFTQFASVASLSAGNGLTKSGNTINVVAASTSRMTIAADSIDVNTSLLPSPVAGDLAKALVATGANTAAWTTIVQKKTFTITGTGAATVFTLNHALNTLDVQVAVYDGTAATANQILCDVQVFDVNNAKVTITPALANAVTYRAVVIG